MLGRRVKAIDKDADYVLDLKESLVRTNQRGKVGCLLGTGSSYSTSRGKQVMGVSRMEEITNDEHYIAFLLDLEDFAEVGLVEEDVEDPEYVRFLDNLIEVGGSYVLKKSIENGARKPIMYEVEDIHSHEVMRINPQLERNDYQRERHFNEIDGENRRSRGVNCTEERSPGVSINGKKLRRSSNCYIQEDAMLDRNCEMKIRHCGANSKRKEITVGESMKSKKSRVPSNSYIQDVRTSCCCEDNMSGLKDYSLKERNHEKITQRKLRSCGINSTQKEKTPGESVKRTISRIPSDTYIHVVTTSDSSRDNVSDLHDSDLFNRMMNSVYEEVQEKRIVGRVTKRRKLTSHIGKYTQEQRSLNDPKSVSESSVLRKKITKPVTFENFQDERTKKKNTSSLGSDYFQHEQCLNMNGDSRSVPDNLSLQKKMIEMYNFFMKNFKPIRESCVYKNEDMQASRLPSDRCFTIVPDPTPISTVPALSNLPSDRRITIVADSSILPINVVPVSCGTRKREIVFGLSSKASTRNKKLPPLPLTVRVATQSQPTQQSRPSLPASTVTMAPLDQQLVVSHRVPTNMRKKLIEILSRPYSKEEHEQLWKELNVRSAVQIHRDSRSGGSDRPGNMGRSLLDWNPDLQSEIEKVKSNPHKVLSLLRMLAFYIKKLPCGNICKPWIDESLKMIMPGSLIPSDGI